MQKSSFSQYMDCNLADFFKNTNLECSFFSKEKRILYKCKGPEFNESARHFEMYDRINYLSKKIFITFKNIGNETITVYPFFEKCVQDSPRFIVDFPTENSFIKLIPGERSCCAIRISRRILREKTSKERRLNSYANKKTRFILEATVEKKNDKIYRISANIKASGREKTKGMYQKIEEVETEKIAEFLFSKPKPKRQQRHIYFQNYLHTKLNINKNLFDNTLLDMINDPRFFSDAEKQIRSPFTGDEFTHEPDLSVEEFISNVFVDNSI